MLLSFSELAILGLLGLGTMCLVARDRHAAETAAREAELETERRRRATADATLKELLENLPEPEEPAPEKTDEVTEAAKQIEELKKSLAGMRGLVARVAGLEKALGDERRAHEATRGARLEAERQARDARREKAGLVRERDALRTRIATLGRLLANARASARDLRDENVALERRIAELLAAAEASASKELVLRRELVGLAGPLRHVVFVFDESYSLRESGRWTEAVGLLEEWVETLEVARCGVVSFSKEAASFHDALVKVHGERNAPVRAAIAKWLDEREPGPNSNLLAALELAHSFEGVDSIVLFTDGRVDSKRRIRRWLSARQQIPINVIGVGDYFSDSAAGFLRDVAERTGGSFRGR